MNTRVNAGVSPTGRFWTMVGPMLLLLASLGACAGKERPFGTEPGVTNDAASDMPSDTPSTATNADGTPPQGGPTGRDGPSETSVDTRLCDGDAGCACNDQVQSCELPPQCDGGVDCAPAATCPGCLIDGECVAAGAPNSLNLCQACDPDRNPSAWSNADGTTCDDGAFCTVDDACQGGSCVGIARDCDDGVACNGTSQCDEQSDRCTDGGNQCGNNALCDTVTDACVTTCAGCVINGSCIASGAAQVGNTCLVCNPAVSTTRYTPALGKACGSGAVVCSLQDTCDESGACQPNHSASGTTCGNTTSSQCDSPDTCDGNGACLARLATNGTTCSDGRFCTVADNCQGGQCVPAGARDCGASQTCDVAADVCRCLDCTINGVCVSAGSVNPANPCQVCTPQRSATGYSANAGANCGAAASVCSGQDTCSEQGVCQRNDFSNQTACGNPGTCGVTNLCDGAGACQNRSIDLNTDPANCGSCGHNCEGGACTRGVCQPFALVSGRSAPRGVIVDATNVYWMEGSSVNRFPRSPRQGATTTAAATNQTGLNSLRRSPTQNRLLWASGNQIIIANADGSVPTALIANRPDPVSGLFLNVNTSLQETLFWAEQDGPDSQTYFFRQATGNGNLPIQSPGGDSVNPTFFGGAADCAFFVDEAFGPTTLYQLCLGGFEFVYEGPGVVRAFHADAQSFYVGAAGQGLIRLNPNTVLVSSSGAMGDIETDATSIYFVDGSSAGNDCTTGGSVARVPKAGGNAQPISSARGCVGQLAVDASAVYWADSVAGEIVKVIKP